MLKNQIDYDALWDEIENELDTDVALDEFQEPANNDPVTHQYYPYPGRYIQPVHYIFFPHRRHLFY